MKRTIALALAVLVASSGCLGSRPGLSTPTPSLQFPTEPWATPPPGGEFKGCPDSGDGTDRELNRLKNRTDDGPWQPVNVSALLLLTWPKGVERQHMFQWSTADRQAIGVHNGVPVQVEGYLLGVRREGPESTNCHSAEDVDFHLWLSSKPAGERSSSVVAEVTPRVRAGHPTWTLEAMQRIVSQRTRLRLSGWTMFDPEHPDQVGKTRGTLWEIHPVLLIESVQAGGGWQEL